jgi:putative tricarboxylic transport membrane protein
VLTLIVFFSAIVMGILAGLLPGIGMLSTMLICYPFLSDLPVLDLLIFYAVAGSTTQFVGSVIASSLGIAAESSSLPACWEGPRLFRRGLGPIAISTCSIGSLFGVLFVTVIGMTLLPLLSETVISFYSNDVQTILFVTVMIILLISAKNKFVINVLLCAFGISLAMIGDNSQLSTEPRLTFGIKYLYDGIPFISMAFALFVLPQVFELSNLQVNKNITRYDITKFSDSAKAWIKVFPSSLRGSMIGSICGLVPGITTILASNLSYTVEKLLRIRRDSYSNDGDLESLVSAETANNSAQMTSMWPLFLFGLPIVGSEAVLLNLIEKNGVAVGWNTLMSDGLFQYVTLAFAASGVVCLFIAWHGVKHLMKIYLIPPNILMLLLFLVSVVGVVVAGMTDFRVYFYLTIFFGLLPIGLILRKLDTSIIVFVFLIYPFLEGALYRFLILHL